MASASDSMRATKEFLKKVQELIQDQHRKINYPLKD